MKHLLLTVCVVLLVWPAIPAQAGSIHTPGPGNPERKAVLDGMRGWVKKVHHLEVVFVVDTLRVKDDWAWVVVDPQSKDGKNKYEPLSAALKKGSNGQWTVILPDPRSEWMAEGSTAAQATRRMLEMLSRDYPDFPAGLVK